MINLALNIASFLFLAYIAIIVIAILGRILCGILKIK